MPVFEAIASGLLVVVTDYIDESTGVYSQLTNGSMTLLLYVSNHLCRALLHGNPYSYCFEPDKDDLYAKLTLATSYDKLRTRFHAKIAGPQYIKSCLTWHIVAEKFLQLIDKKVYDKPFIRIDEPRGNMVFATETTIKDGLSINMLFLGLEMTIIASATIHHYGKFVSSQKNCPRDTVCCAKIHKS